MIMTDTYIEQVPIPDGTPEEMAQAFVDITNKAFTEDRTGFSKAEHGIRTVQLTDSWKLEFKDSCFVILQWSCMKDPEED